MIGARGSFLMIAGLLAVALNGGCGSGDKRLPTYPAGGRVVYADGTPLTEGIVEFQAVEGERQQSLPSARATIKPDGTFRMGTYETDDGALEGEHRAIVVVHQLPPGIGEAAKPVPVAPKYGSFDTSGLTVTVTDDPAKNEFELKVEKP